MMKNLEKLSPRPARFAVFFVLLVYIFATSTAKPLSSMDESGAKDVSAQSGNLDSNHRVNIPTVADIHGVPAKIILAPTAVEGSHRYPRSLRRPVVECRMDRSGLCRVVKSGPAILATEIRIKD